MGNRLSGQNFQKKDDNIFEKELDKINTVVNSIINDKDLFIDKNYDFLSQDVCKKYNIVLEEELNKHLKINLKMLGTSLYILPKHEDESKKNITKKEVCEMISDHYIKILYILCLIKYVYNLEKNGDMSIAGIIFGNIKILKDELLIQYCELPHSDYSKEDKHKIDFSKLKGMSFFTQYFLTIKESNIFIGILKSVLSKSKKPHMKEKICNYVLNNRSPQVEAIKNLYETKYKERINCGTPALIGHDMIEERHQKQIKLSNLFLYIEKENPVFSYDLCRSIGSYRFKTTSPEGKDAFKLYITMKKNYDKNISDVEKILNSIVEKSDNKYNLKDITKDELDIIINDVKSKIQLFYIQTIVDYQNLFDHVKKMPPQLFIQ